jgi:sirohydrochlorin cobaltochelatase
MPRARADDDELTALEDRIRLLLPPDYHDTYESMLPIPMKSAPLKFDADGDVAWNEMWGSFCDLAMAGGPPHKGSLLGPASDSAIAQAREPYERVRAEICRGIRTVTSLETQPSPVGGWVRVSCLGEGMAGWLLRAIVMENVAARASGTSLDLPAGPDFRLEKEIRNVVTVASKTCHYWMDHMPFSQQRAVTALLGEMEGESPLIGPGAPDEAAAGRLAADIERRTGLRAADPGCAGWLGLSCTSVRAAVWMMRALAACNVLARREETRLYVPVDAARDPGGHVVASAVARVHRLALARGVS